MKQGDATPDARRRALDREINRVKSRIEMAYRRAMADFIITHQKLRGNPEQYNRQIEALAERYRQQVRIEIEKVITEYRQASADRYAGVYGQLSGVGAGQWAEAFKGAYALSPEVSAAVDRAGMQFLREMELYDRLLNVSGTDIGTLQGGHLSARQFSELMFLKNNTLAASKAGIDLHEWRKGVYGIDTLEPSSALFGQQIAREMVTDDYRMQNAFGQKIPEVLGFRISVCPTNKRGLARTHDICDELAGDYPKDFVFTGWHYNCRCLSQPIIDRAYLTAELEAMGFVGVDKGTKIAVLERTTKLITGQVDRYREAYPALVQANYVRFRGQERLMSELKADELLTYHFEDFVEKNSTQGFLQGTSGLDVGITEPSDPEVFMDTRLKGDRYRFNVSSLDAADGHNPARDALSAFQAAGTGRPLTRVELSAAQDITHEMVHTMGRDASYAELAGQYPERLDELVNFTTDPGSAERQALEMVTEWYAREIFPQVAANQRWTLPADYTRYLGTGYVNSVANLQTFLEYLPNGDEVRQRLAELLRRGDKAFAYRYLQDIIRESGVLKSGRKPGPVLNKMLGEQDPEAFRAYMDGAARAENVQVAQGIRQAAAVAVADQMGEVAGRLSGDADYVRLGQNPQETAKRLGQGLKVEKNGLLNVRAESFLRGGRMLALGAPAVVISASVRENTSPTGNDPESPFPHYTRYVPPIIYRMGGHMTGVTAGMIDGAIDMGLETKNMMADIAKFGLSAVMKAGQVISPSPAGTVGAYGAGKYDEIVAKGDALLSELKDFIVLYINDKDFRANINQALGGELKDYFSRLAGVSGEQGYAQGRLIVDIGSFLFGLGELKGITNSWKRLKKIDLTGVLSKLKKPEQKVIKTENIKYIDDAFAMVEEHAPKNLPEAIVHPHKTQKTPTGLEIKSNILSTVDNTPGEFITGGDSFEATPPEIINIFTSEFNNFVRQSDSNVDLDVVEVVKNMINSGTKPLRMATLEKRITLYKIVPKGVRPSNHSPFWMTEDAVRNAVQSGQLEQLLGLPKASISDAYEIYKITLKPEFLSQKTPIFSNIIAPTEEGGYSTSGTAKQVLIPNRHKWTTPEKVVEFNFNKK